MTRFASAEWLWEHLDSVGRLQAQAEYAVLKDLQFSEDDLDGAAWKEFEMARIEHFVEGYRDGLGRDFSGFLLTIVSDDQRQRLAAWRAARAQMFIPEKHKGLAIFKDDEKGDDE